MTFGSAGAEAAFPGENGRIAFESCQRVDTAQEVFRCGIYTVAPDGSDRRRLTRGRGPDFTPAFSPDASTIAFAAFVRRPRRLGPDIEIYTVGANGRRQRRLTGGPGRAESPAFSAYGTVAFMRRWGSYPDLEYGIFTRAIAGGAERRLTYPMFSDEDPAFSPDGQKIAFTRFRLAKNQIFVMDADGSDQRLLMDIRGDCQQPAFSPDGKQIVFARTPPSVAAAGSRARAGSRASATATGRIQIPTGIYVINADGSGGERRLTSTIESRNEDFSDRDPAFSPDGTRIVFTRRRGGRPQLYTMLADGSHQTPLSPSASDDRQPDWGVRRHPRDGY